MARRKNTSSAPAAAELNVMPFIDIFSMLVTFLLVSAVFVSIGIVEVQVPFLSNAPADKSKPKREISIKVDIEKEAVKVTTEFSVPPADKKETAYKINEGDLAKMHRQFISIKQKNPDADTVTVFADDDVKFQNLVIVLDEIKLLHPDDPKSFGKDKDGEKKRAGFLFPKLVMGSVLL